MTPFDAGLWIDQAPQSFLGLQVGARMTVVRLSTGDLLVYSPLLLTEARLAAVRALGTVTHIVAPGAFHHLYAPAWSAAWPEAIVHGPEVLRTKNPALRLDRPLSNGAHPDWAGTLVPLPIDGSHLHETVFIHTPTRTLLTCDLVENQQKVDHLPTRLYLQLFGAYQTVSWPGPGRWLYHDKAAACRSVERVLEQDFDRAILAHGDVLTTDTKPQLRAALGFLGVR